MNLLLVFILLRVVVVVECLESTKIKTILASGEILDSQEEVCNKEQTTLDYFDNKICFYNNSHIPNAESFNR